MKNFVKKIISATIGLILICLLICIPINVYAATSGMCGPSGAYWDFDFNSNTLTITGTGEMFDFESIRPEWYSKKTSLYHIVIEEGITSIGKNAFDGLGYVETVTLPDTIEQIGDYAFRACESITNIDIGDNCQTIGNGAFQRCYSLKSVILSEKLKSIGESAFHFNEKLANITLPKSLTTIGENAFMSCSSLCSITIPEKITEIPQSAFKGCSNLTSVVLGANIEAIGPSAFYNCKSLNNITIPSLVNTIGASAFYHCDNLSNIIIPHSVETISTRAFAYCKNLSSIVISNSVTELPFWCFYKCKKGISITLPPTVTVIDKDAFEDSSPVLNGEKNSYAQTYADEKGYNFVELNSYKIIYNANGGQNAPPVQTKFENINTKLYSSVPTRDGYKCLGWATSSTATSPTYSVGATITTNHNLNLYAVWGLKELYPEVLANGTCGENLKWTFDDNGLLTISGIGDMMQYASTKAFPWYEYASEIKNVEIHSEVTSVSNEAFSEYPNLKTATIGVNPTAATKSTMTIGNDAFYGCKSLTTVKMNDSVKSIGNDSFYECTNLTTVSLGNGLLSIGRDAFSYCTSMQSIVIPDSVTSVGEYVFSDCENLSQITIGKGLTAIPSRAFSDNTSLTDISIPNNIRSIGGGAFLHCKNLTCITIPASVNTIGTAPFEGCENLQSITVDAKNSYYMAENGVLFNRDKTRLIQYPAGKQGNYTLPENVVTICKSAFSRCGKLSEIILSKELKYIETEAFYLCNNIISLIIPNGVLSIGEYAFEDCTQLSSIDIPNSVTVLCADAFTGCENLKTVVIGSGVTEINSDTFDSCESLQSVVIYPSVTSIASSAFSNCNTSVVIKGKANSYAETFAKANNITFEALSTYTIAYDANGGSNAPQSQVKFYNVDTNLSGSIPTKINYSFLGWSTKSNSESAEYASGACINVDSNTTLYAVWSLLYPENIKASTDTVTLFVGDTEQVFVSIHPSTVPNKNVIWESENTNIATVNNGLITAISAGNTTVTVTSENDKRDTIIVKVLKPTNNIDFSLSEAKQSPTSSNIKITIDGDKSLVKNIKWAYGSQNEDYFTSNGTSVDISMLNALVDKNGIYTFCLTDVDNNKKINTINVSKIAIGQPQFTNASGELEFANELYIPINFDEIEENITIYMALYDNGKLTKLEKTLCIPSENVGKRDFNKTFKVTYPKKGYELKAFVWNENLMPYLNSISLKTNTESTEQLIEGTIGADVVQPTFTVNESKSYNIKSYIDDNSKIALYGYLFDSDDNFVAMDENDADAGFEFNVNLEAGKTYKLLLLNMNENATGSYIIVVK